MLWVGYQVGAVALDSVGKGLRQPGVLVRVSCSTCYQLIDLGVEGSVHHDGLKQRRQLMPLQVRLVVRGLLLLVGESAPEAGGKSEVVGDGLDPRLPAACLCLSIRQSLARGQPHHLVMLTARHHHCTRHVGREPRGAAARRRGLLSKKWRLARPARCRLRCWRSRR